MPTSHPLRLPACGGSSPALWVLTFRLGIGFFAVPRSALREIRDWTRSGFPRRMRSPAPCPLVDLRFLTGRPNTPPEKDWLLIIPYGHPRNRVFEGWRDTGLVLA